eukprot:8771957-Prorocentrum_lima.AAC.1
MPGIVLQGGVVIHPAQKAGQLNDNRALSWAINYAYEHQRKWDEQPDYRLAQSHLGCTRNNHKRYSTLPWDCLLYTSPSPRDSTSS